MGETYDYWPLLLYICVCVYVCEFLVFDVCCLLSSGEGACGARELSNHSEIGF